MLSGIVALSLPIQLVARAKSFDEVDWAVLVAERESLLSCHRGDFFFISLYDEAVYFPAIDMSVVGSLAARHSIKLKVLAQEPDESKGGINYLRAEKAVLLGGRLLSKAGKIPCSIHGGRAGMERFWRDYKIAKLQNRRVGNA